MAVSNSPVGTEEKGKATHHMGRPKLVLDDMPVDKYELAEYLASLMCTNEEIAVGLGISLSTLYARLGNKNYSYVKKDGTVTEVCDAHLQEAITRGKERGKMELRRILRAQAKRGNTAAGIFLAKNELGYSDRQRVQHEGERGGVTIVNEPGAPASAKPPTVPAMQPAAADNEVRDGV